MKKRGFTLIELLAVIVVLAIIPLIATPIVMNIIKSAKKEAAERSAERYLKAIETVFASERLDGSPMDEGTYTVSGGKITKDGQEYTVEVTGTVPEKGTVIINRNGTVEVESLIVDGHLCLTKENRIDCNKTENKSASTTDSILTLKDGQETYLTDYKIYGNSFQQTYTGKNLFDINKVILSNGNIISADDSSLEFSYSESVTDFFAFSYWLEVEPNTDYSISMNSISLGHIYIYSDKLFGTTVAPYVNCENTTATFNSGDNEKVLLGFYSIKGYRDGSGKEIVSNIQIEKGSTATTYEPYVGGIPSPNPEYPQEIVSLGNLVTDENNANYGKYEIPVKVSGKNLYSGENISSTVYAHRLMLNGISSSKFADDLLKIPAGEQVVVSWDYLGSTEGAHNNIRLRADGNVLLIIANGRPFTMIDTSNVDEIIAYMGQNSLGSVYSNIQIEKGSTATDYEPYQERTYSIYLDEPLRKLGDYKDYIDFEKGEVVRVIKQAQVNGSNTFTKMPDITDYSLFWISNSQLINSIDVKNVEVISNKFNYHSCGTCNYNNKWSNNYQIGVAVSQYYKRVHFTLPNTITDAQKWFADNPVDYIYPTSEPSHTPITLPKIKLFDGVNHITVGTNIAAGEISVNYYN